MSWAFTRTQVTYLQCCACLPSLHSFPPICNYVCMLCCRFLFIYHPSYIGNYLPIESRRLQMDYSQDCLLLCFCELLSLQFSGVVAYCFASIQCCACLCNPPRTFHLTCNSPCSLLFNSLSLFTFRDLYSNQITSLASGLFIGSSLRWLWVILSLRMV